MGYFKAVRIECVILLLSLLVCLATVGSAIAAPEKISLQLTWKHQFQFAGYYVAKEKGFYSDAGLDVEIKEYQSNWNLLNRIVNGQADFAVGRSSIIIEKANGSNIVALFAGYQKSPLMLLTRASSGIKTPSDLKNKKIMLTQDAASVADVMAMLLQSGVREEDFIRQSHSFNIDDLVNGHTDAMGSYISNEPYQLKQKGIAYNIIHPKDFGFEIYSDILFTSRKFIGLFRKICG